MNLNEVKSEPHWIISWEAPKKYSVTYAYTADKKSKVFLNEEDADNFMRNLIECFNYIKAENFIALISKKYYER